MIHQEHIKPLFITAAVLILAAIAGTLFTPTSSTGMFSLALAIFTYIILPGYCILLHFNITSLERIIFGMPLSITIVSIALYSVDIFGVPLSRTTIVFIILIISSIALYSANRTTHSLP